MLLLDRLLVSGVRFVLDKVATAADAELNDDAHLREELLAAQLRVELGELSPEEFAAFEADILARLREIRERQRGEAEASRGLASGELKVTGAEATTYDGKE